MLDWLVQGSEVIMLEMGKVHPGDSQRWRRFQGVRRSLLQRLIIKSNRGGTRGEAKEGGRSGSMEGDWGQGGQDRGTGLWWWRGRSELKLLEMQPPPRNWGPPAVPSENGRLLEMKVFRAEKMKPPCGQGVRKKASRWGGGRHSQWWERRTEGEDQPGLRASGRLGDCLKDGWWLNGVGRKKT